MILPRLVLLYYLPFNDCISGLSTDSYINIKLYPNPTRDIFYIQGNSILTIQVIDASGKILVETIENKIDLSILPGGIYYVSIKHADGVSVKKIIKE